MCSINGFLAFSGINESVEKNIKNIIQRSTERGNDSCGIAVFNDASANQLLKTTENFSKLKKDLSLNSGTVCLLNNNRAEPTTEYVENKTFFDVQPYFVNHNFTVHNGTIANDKEIIKKYNLKLSTNIDSAILPHIFEMNSTSEGIAEFLINEVIGSYALANYNEENNMLYLATNYKPLYIMYNSVDDVLYFSSLEKYLKDTSNYSNILNSSSIREVKPYTMITVCQKTKEIKSYDLYPKKERKRALIIASSGLDSTVAAAWAIKKGYEIELLHYKYKCRAEKKENKHIQKIANYFNVKVTNINLNFFKDVIGGSSLLDDNAKISKKNDGKDGAEFAIEWVPARNLVFMSIASAYAEAHNFDYIILGGNLEESGAYSDNEYIFQKKFNDLLPNSLNLGHQVEVLTPLANLMKKDIVKLGKDVNAPLHLTWSCYENNDLHCGTCGPCFMRKTAFKINNLDEVIKYQND